MTLHSKFVSTFVSTFVLAASAALAISLPGVATELRAQGAASAPGMVRTASGPVRDSVVAVVQEFFDAIQASDSTRAESM